MAFKSVSAPEMPNIACIGEVTSIEDTKVSKKGVYNVTPISITPRGGGFPSKLYFLSRPEWLAPDFTPDVDLEGQKGAQFVYSRNIQNYKGKGPAVISGLAGSQERADKLIDEIQAQQHRAHPVTVFNPAFNPLQRAGLYFHSGAGAD